MAGIFQTLLGSLAGVAKDAFWKYVTLLLPGNGTNGAQNNTFLDASTNNFTITRNGNTTQGTFTPYGANWSNYFDGTGDYLTVANNTAFALPGDFTLEMWVYPITRAGALFGLGDYRTGADGFSLYYATNKLRLFVNNADVLSGASDITPNQWSHIALVRSGAGTNNLKLYINGTQDAQATVTTSFTGVAANGVAIDNDYGGSFGATTSQNYLSNVRLVKGTAVYTANFTPPTAPLTAITNTSLLTCQSNRLIDNSTNAFTITKNGDVSVQRFSPFSPSAAYAAADIGGSGYFDGTGDYLTVADSASLELGSGNWTIEGWFYVTSGTGDRVLYGRDNNSGADVLIRLSTGSNNLQVYLSSDGTTFGISSTGAISGATVNYNAWNHFAVTSSSGTIRKGINGVMDNIGTLASIVNSTKTWYVGARGNVSEYFPGYISNLRVVIGTAVYAASTYTVPTSPLTAITNTQLLLNFTNAGIIDNAMLNDLETVGNAQISTAQSKFGGSSIAFDGTGDYLTSPGNVRYIFGTADFTVECWLYLNAINRVNGIWTNGPASAGSFGFYITNGNKIEASYYGGATVTGATSLTTGQWYHIAVSRSGTTTRIFLNGTQDATNTSSNNNTTGDCVVGNSFTNQADSPNGYIDDLRITKGYARYTANFTPPGALPTS